VRLLTVNAGSSSLRLRVLDAEDRVVASFSSLPTELPAVDAVVHRVVHGGTTFTGPVVVDADVEAQIRALTELAPLHQPKSLAALDAVRDLLPGVPQVACFDTAFHSTIPAAAATYALPAEWTRRYGLRRFGFHGLSHAWAVRRTALLFPNARRMVTCHLGAGASLCAVLDGRSVDTTMGFTPLEGLVMATRSGSVDPGLVLWLAEREPDVAAALERRSGLLGLADSADMVELLGRTDEAAQLALAVYLHRLRAGIAAMAASLGGLDACVFIGGVGENSPVVRERAAAGLGFLGIQVDPERNASGQPQREISNASSPVRVLVEPAREDLEMASQARTLLESRSSPA
jgi:acetate kinase